MDLLIMPWPDPSTEPSEYRPLVLERQLEEAQFQLEEAFETYIQEYEKAYDPDTGYYPDDSSMMTALKSTAKATVAPNDLFLYSLERKLINARLNYWKVKRKLFERDQLRHLQELDESLTSQSTSFEEKREIVSNLKPTIKNRIRYNALMYRYEHGLARSEQYRVNDTPHEFSQTERGVGVTIGVAELFIARKLNSTPGTYLKNVLRPYLEARKQFRIRNTPEGTRASARNLQTTVRSRLETILGHIEESPRLASLNASSSITRKMLEELEIGASFRQAVEKTRQALQSGSPVSKAEQALLSRNGPLALVRYHYQQILSEGLTMAQMKSIPDSWNRIIKDPNFASIVERFPKNLQSAQARTQALEALEELEKSAKRTSATVGEVSEMLRRDLKRAGKLLSGLRGQLTQSLRRLTEEAEVLGQQKGTTHPDYLKNTKRIQDTRALLNRLEENHLAATKELDRLKKQWKKGSPRWMRNQAPFKLLRLVFSAWITFDGIKNIIGHGSVLYFEDDLKLEDEGRDYELSQNVFSRFLRSEARFFRDYRRNQQGVFWKYFNPSDAVFLAFAWYYSAEKTEALLELESQLGIAEADLAEARSERTFDQEAFQAEIEHLRTLATEALETIGMTFSEAEAIQAAFESVKNLSGSIDDKEKIEIADLKALETAVGSLLSEIMPVLSGPESEKIQDNIKRLQALLVPIQVDQALPEFDPLTFSEIEQTKLEMIQKERDR